jgi:hypothetical protein
MNTVVNGNNLESVREMAKNIIENATKLVEFKPEPLGNRFNMRTYIFCVDEIPSNYITRMIDTLYFINDRHGYFISNQDNIVNLSKSIEEWDTGIDKYIVTSKENMGTVGTRLLLNVDGDIQVHKIVGWETSDHSSSVYFDVK